MRAMTFFMIFKGLYLIVEKSYGCSQQVHVCLKFFGLFFFRFSQNILKIQAENFSWLWFYQFTSVLRLEMKIRKFFRKIQFLIKSEKYTFFVEHIQLMWHWSPLKIGLRGYWKYLGLKIDFPENLIPQSRLRE